jgi:hypothetical protein
MSGYKLGLVFNVRTANRATLVALFSVLVGAACHAATIPLPTRDDEVVEVLPAVTRSRPPASAALQDPTPVRNPAVAISLARQAITVARQTGDARYWGRAESALTQWWDKPDAPVELAILQATVQQGRHAFGSARRVLEAALARAPDHAQGWLDLAALERVEGNYPKALVACEAVARAGQILYAQACNLETGSLQGRKQASDGFRRLLAGLPSRSADSQHSYLNSLLAESEERAGRDAEARDAYTTSLAAEKDLYTVIAFSDLLLRTGDNHAVVNLLAGQPLTDAVLLRQALAQRRLNDPQWRATRAELHDREAALDRRGDDPNLHDRERALLALWLDDAPPRALELAQRNLQLQREPIDWLIALQASLSANDKAAHADLLRRVQAIGLQDTRLTALSLMPTARPQATREIKP